MASFPFSLLVLACLTGLLGLRFGLALGLPGTPAGAPDAPVEASSAMAVPPKPGGLAPPTGGGTGAGDAALTPSICEAMSSQLWDICWQALARQTASADPEEALRICARLATTELANECQADVAEAVAPASRDLAERICKDIPVVKWRGQCHFGIGLALAETDPAYAIARCQDAEAFRTFCRHDVVGEMAMVDLPAAVEICGREEGDTLTRKTCWHGIGKYLARRDMVEAAASCSQATRSWQALCYHGVGWGGAERDVDQALTSCASFGEFADNCRHGVANQLKRSDPTRQLAICEALQNPEARTKCLAFVTQ
ncbi:MAG: hypothetical protein EXR71_03095 [Myxococcales bacterium]|nr:hypothetical protein [Myxococcales bacterium]